MSKLSTRSLKIDISKITKSDENFVFKYTCSMQGCGSDFDVSISKHDYDTKESKKRRYNVRCKSCIQKFKISELQTKRFTRIFGCEVRVVDNMFDELFEADE